LKIFQDAFYLPVEGGRCFAVLRAPADADVCGTVLHLPAFGDEMNKSRAMTARAARAFAEAGFAVLQVDWLGCGDSSGDHADATLTKWVANARESLKWLRHRHPQSATTLWALRAGALIVPSLVRETPDASLLLWQPVLDGAQLLNHLLRLKAAGAITGARDAASSTKALRERLRAGEALDIGGYEISPTLAVELEAAAFELPAAHRADIGWFEVAASPRSTMSPAAATHIERARAGGARVVERIVEGPGFWQSVEIERGDALIAQSIAALTEGMDARSGASALL
jgi:exosortase A-associated hydrolase 2